MITTYNFNPYYDDFDPSKNYYRILFKPGYAVQARELTQLQTIIQEQINRFGSSIFENGSIVDNGRTTFEKLSYYIFNDRLFDISKNDYLVGQTSGSKVQVLNIDGNNIWFKNLNNKEFDFTETVSVYDSSMVNIRGNLTFNQTLPVGFGSRFTIEESIFFLKGHFVYIPNDDFFIYNDLPTLRLGISYEEKIVKPDSDTTLLDPAAGSYNYSAPGADRYQIDLKLDSKDYDPISYDSNKLASENFIELMRLVNGVIEKRVTSSDYSTLEDTLARRTYDESGNYTVEPFIGKIISTKPTAEQLNAGTTFSEDLANTVTLSLSPGKAYVGGYEFETLINTNLPIDKARTVKYVSGGVSNYSYGDYIYVDTLKGYPNLSSSPKITLRNSSLQVIGNAHVTGLSYYQSLNSKQIYKLYLTDVIFTGINTFSSVANVTIQSTDPQFFANVSSVAYSNSTPYVITSYEKAAFSEVPSKYVASLTSQNGSPDTIWYGFKEYTATFEPSSANTSYATVTQFVTDNSFIGGGVLDEYETNENYFVVVTTNSGSGPTKDFVLNHQNNLRITVESPNKINLFWSNTSTNFNNFGTGGSNQVKLFAKIALSNWPARTKTLVSNTHIFTGNLISNTVITLPKTDGWALLNVFVSNTTTGISNDVTAIYSFSGGQKDSYYDFARVTRIGSFPSIFNTYVPDRLNVSFQHFTHENKDGFFTVDSYKNSGISFSQIPVYKSSSGVVYDLADVIDFRKSRVDSNTFFNSITPIIGENISFDYSFYLGRKDRITATKDQNFRIIKGIPSENSQYPSVTGEDMLIYDIEINPYTYSLSDVKIKYIDNRRYTMKDIGKIDKRVGRVEYYTALTLLEKQAQDLKIPSNFPGQDKFKSGIVVDPFVDLSVADVANPDFSCSVDVESRELRPGYESYFYNLVFDSAQNVVKRNNLYMLDYVASEFASQKLTSRFRNLNPLNKTQWTGSLKISPGSDVWKEIYPADLSQYTGWAGDRDAQSLSTLSIFSLDYDDLVSLRNYGTGKFNNWEKIITGVSSSLGDTRMNPHYKNDLTKLGTTTIYDESNTEIIVDTFSGVIDRSAASFMRPQSLQFVSTGHLPDTQLYFYTTNGYKFTERSTFIQYTEIVLDKNVPSNITKVQQSIGGNVVFQADVVNTHENRMFVNGDDGVIYRANNITLYNGTQVVTTANVVGRNISSSGKLISNDFGVVAGKLIVKSNSIPAGKFKFVISDTNDSKGLTWNEVDYVVEGTKELVATFIISSPQPRAPEPADITVPDIPIVVPSVIPPDPTSFGERKVGYFACDWSAPASPRLTLPNSNQNEIDVHHDYIGQFLFYDVTFSDDNTIDEYTISLRGPTVPNSRTTYNFGDDLVLSTTVTPSPFTAGSTPSSSKYYYKLVTPSWGNKGPVIDVPSNETRTLTICARRSFLSGGGTKLFGVWALSKLNLSPDKPVDEKINDVLKNFKNYFPLPTLTCPSLPPPEAKILLNLNGYEKSIYGTRGSISNHGYGGGPGIGTVTDTYVEFVVDDIFNGLTDFIFDPNNNWGLTYNFNFEWRDYTNLPSYRNLSNYRQYKTAISDYDAPGTSVGQYPPSFSRTIIKPSDQSTTVKITLPKYRYVIRVFNYGETFINADEAHYGTKFVFSGYLRVTASHNNNIIAFADSGQIKIKGYLT